MTTAKTTLHPKSLDSKALPGKKFVRNIRTAEHNRKLLELLRRNLLLQLPLCKSKS
jgi:hypothetical protein